MPRPTPRQRAVLEAMAGGRSTQSVSDRTIQSLLKHGWIRKDLLRVYAITEAGRRAVARSDGGV